jgi:hypothetical protein
VSKRLEAGADRLARGDGVSWPRVEAFLRFTGWGRAQYAVASCSSLIDTPVTRLADDGPRASGGLEGWLTGK